MDAIVGQGGVYLRYPLFGRLANGTQHIPSIGDLYHAEVRMDLVALHTVTTYRWENV